MSTKISDKSAMVEWKSSSLRRIRIRTIAAISRCLPLPSSTRCERTNHATGRRSLLLLSCLWSLHVANAEYLGSYYSPTSSHYQEEQKAEEQRLHAIIVEDWYDLVRYLVGLGFCIFGLIGLYFHQFASYYFLKQYTNLNGTERKMGRVIACEPMRIRQGNTLSKVLQDPATFSPSSSSSGETSSDQQQLSQEDPKKGFRIFVVYSASAPSKRSMCGVCGPDTSTVSNPNTRETSISDQALMETEYFQWFRTGDPMPVDSRVTLILLKDNPKSACTPELLNSHLMQAFHQKHCGAITLLGISLILGVVILCLASIFEIRSMPHPETQRPIGWSILISFFFVFSIAGYIFCKMLFDHFKAKVFLSAIPIPAVQKRLRPSFVASGTDAIVANLEDDPKMAVAACILQQAHMVDLESTPTGPETTNEDETSTYEGVMLDFVGDEQPKSSTLLDHSLEDPAGGAISQNATTQILECEMHKQ